MLIDWNRLILLHGPPGTGKTSLCQAIAQKLSIRLGKHCHSSKLVELDSHTLLSKYFGESSKLVSRVFGEILNMLAEEKDTFVYIIIDEIESLATARETSNNEPRDSIRVGISRA